MDPATIQPLSYGDVLKRYKAVTQDPELKNISLPDYAAAMKEVDPTRDYSQGLTDNFIRRAGAWRDDVLDTPLPGVGRGVTSMATDVGRFLAKPLGPEYQESFGQATGSLPRLATDMLGAAAIGGATALVAPEAAGVAGIAALAGLSGLGTYADTGSVGQGALTAGITAAGFPAGKWASQAVLGKMGAPTVGKFMENKFPGLAGGLLDQASPMVQKFLGEKIPGSVGQFLASTGASGAAQWGVETGGNMISRMTDDNPDTDLMPSLPELAASLVTQGAFSLFDLARPAGLHGTPKTVQRILEKQIPVWQNDYVSSATRAYVEATGVEPAPETLAAFVKQARGFGGLTRRAEDLADSELGPVFDVESKGDLVFPKDKLLLADGHVPMPEATLNLAKVLGDDSMSRTNDQTAAISLIRASNTFLEQNGRRPTQSEVYGKAADVYRALEETDAQLEKQATGGGEDAMRAFEEQQKEMSARKIEAEQSRRLAEDAVLAERAKSDPGVAQRLAWLGGTPEEMKAAGLPPGRNFFDRVTNRMVEAEADVEDGTRRNKAVQVTSAPKTDREQELLKRRAQITKGVKDVRQVMSDKRDEKQGMFAMEGELSQSAMKELELIDEELAAIGEGKDAPEETIVEAEGTLDEEGNTKPGQMSRNKQTSPEESRAMQMAAMQYDKPINWNDPASVKQFENTLSKAQKAAVAGWNRGERTAPDETVQSFAFTDPASQKLAKSSASKMAAELNQGRTPEDMGNGVAFTAVKQNNMYRVKKSVYTVTHSLDKPAPSTESVVTDNAGLIAEILKQLEAGETVSPAMELTDGMTGVAAETNPGRRFGKYRAAAENIAAAIGSIERTKIRDLLGQTSNRTRGEVNLSMSIKRAMQYAKFVMNGGDLKIVVKKAPKTQIAMSTLDRAEAEEYMRTANANDRSTRVVDATLRKEKEGVKKDVSAGDEISEYSGYYRLIESPVDESQIEGSAKVYMVVKDIKGTSESRAEFVGDIVGFNNLLRKETAGFEPSKDGDESRKLNERSVRASGMNVAEDTLAILHLVGKQYEDPRKLWERPAGDFGFFPRPAFDEKTGKYHAVYDPETGELVDRTFAIKAGAMPIHKANTGTVDVVVDGKVVKAPVKGYNPLLTAMSTMLNKKGSVTVQEFGRLLRDLPDKEYTAEDKQVLDLIDFLTNKDNKRSWTSKLNVSIGIAKNVAKSDSERTYGYYSYHNDLFEGGGILMSPYRRNEKTGFLEYLAPHEIARHFLHELTHANTVHAIQTNAPLRAEWKKTYEYVQNMYAMVRQNGEGPRIRSLEATGEAKDVLEFAADFFVDRDLQDFLFKLPDATAALGPVKGPTMSTFHRLWQSLRAYFAKVFGAKGQTLADRVSRLMEQTLVEHDAMQVEYRSDIHRALAERIFGSSSNLVKEIDPTPTVRTPDETGGKKGFNEGKGGEINPQAAAQEGQGMGLTAKQAYMSSEQMGEPEVTEPATVPPEPGEAQTLESKGGFGSRQERNMNRAFATETTRLKSAMPEYHRIKALASSAIRIGDQVRFSFSDGSKQAEFMKDIVDRMEYKVQGSDVFIPVKSLLEVDQLETDNAITSHPREQAMLKYSQAEGMLPQDFNAYFDRVSRLTATKDDSNQILESTGSIGQRQITPEDVVKAMKYGVTKLVRRPDGGVEYETRNGGPIPAALLRTSADNGRNVVTKEELLRAAQELTQGASRQVAGQVFASMPQTVTSMAAFKKMYMEAGFQKPEAERYAQLLIRFTQAIEAKPFVGLTTKAGVNGWAANTLGLVGLNKRLPTTTSITDIADVVVHEFIHIADQMDVLDSVYKSLTPEQRKDLVNVAQLMAGVTPNVDHGTLNAREFASSIGAALAQLYTKPGATNLSVATKEALMFMGPEITALLTSRLTDRENVFTTYINNAGAMTGQYQWAAKVVDVLKPMMKEVRRVELQEDQFMAMRTLYTDTYKTMLEAAGSSVDDSYYAKVPNSKRDLDLKGYDLEPSYVTSTGGLPGRMLRDEIALGQNTKLGWWNKNMKQFTHLADQFPALKPVWDVLTSANGLAKERVAQVQELLAGSLQQGQLKKDQRMKDLKKFYFDPTMQEAFTKLALWEQKLGDSGKPILSPLERDNFLALNGMDADKRKIVLQMHDSVLKQMDVVGDMIVQGHRSFAETVGALYLRKAMKGLITTEQAKEASKLAYQLAELQHSGNPVAFQQAAQQFTALVTDPAVRMQLLTDASETTYGKLDPTGAIDPATGQVKMIGGLITEIAKITKGKGWWMSERRFGEYGIYYKDRNGKMQSHFVKTEGELETFRKAKGINEADVVKLITPAAIDKSFGMSASTLQMWEDAQTAVVNRQRIALKSAGLSDADIDTMMAQNDVLNDVRNQLLAKDVSRTSLPRRGGANRDSLTMFDVQQNYISAVIHSLKNKQVRLEGQLAFTDPTFDVQPEIKNLAQQHIEQSLKPDTDWGRRIALTNFTYFMGANLSAMILEPFQQLMSLAPVLVQHGAGVVESYKHIKDANIAWGKAKLTKSFGSPELDQAMEVWRKQGHADYGIYQEIDHNTDLSYINAVRGAGGLSQFSPFDLLKNKAYALTNIASRFYMTVPAYNSEVALIAAYKSLRSAGLTHENAVQQAVFLKQSALFGGGKMNRPVGLFGINRTAAQVMYSLQGYTTGMLGLMHTLINESFKGSKGMTPAQLTQARKAAVQMLGTQFIAGGALGMPFVAAMLAGLQKLVPEINWEQTMREWITGFDKEDEEAAGMLGNFVSKGLPGVFSQGPDFSSRFAIGGVLGVSPYDGFSLENVVGPTTSIAKNILTSGQRMAQADPRALEPLIPPGLKKMWDTLKQRESFQDAKGRELVGDLSAGEQAGRFVGFVPNRVRDVRDTARMARANETAASARMARLTDRLADLYLKGSVEQARNEIMGLPREEQASVTKAIASRIEQKTMPSDPREIGSRQTAVQQSELLRMMGSGTQLPTQMDRLALRQQVVAQLQVPGVRPAQAATYGRAAALDQIMQMQPSLSKAAAMLLLDSPQSAFQPRGGELGI